MAHTKNYYTHKCERTTKKKSFKFTFLSLNVFLDHASLYYMYTYVWRNKIRKRYKLISFILSFPSVSIFIVHFIFSQLTLSLSLCHLPNIQTNTHTSNNKQNERATTNLLIHFYRLWASAYYYGPKIINTTTTTITKSTSPSWKGLFFCFIFSLRLIHSVEMIFSSR